MAETPITTVRLKPELIANARVALDMPDATMAEVIRRALLVVCNGKIDPSLLLRKSAVIGSSKGGENK